MLEHDTRTAEPAGARISALGIKYGSSRMGSFEGVMGRIYSNLRVTGTISNHSLRYLLMEKNVFDRSTTMLIPNITIKTSIQMTWGEEIGNIVHSRSII